MNPLFPWSKKPHKSHPKLSIKPKLEKLDFAERKAEAEVKVTDFLEAMKASGAYIPLMTWPKRAVAV